jgi:hypothetical protein
MNLRPLVALGLACVIGLIGAGCGANASSESGTDRSPSTTDSPGATAISSPGAKLTARDKAVKWAACIRAHGVSDFPDPGPKNDVNYGVSVSRDVWTGAVSACKALQPPGTLSSKRTPKQQSATLRFAACVRAHGVKDFPDPANGQPVIDTYKIPSANRPGGMTVLNAATKTCGKVLGKAAGGQG